MKLYGENRTSFPEKITDYYAGEMIDINLFRDAWKSKAKFENEGYTVKGYTHHSPYLGEETWGDEYRVALGSDEIVFVLFYFWHFGWEFSVLIKNPDGLYSTNSTDVVPAGVARAVLTFIATGQETELVVE
nr:MAG TPA: hypothetical protein [Caudoviricetes sp.]